MDCPVKPDNDVMELDPPGKPEDNGGKTKQRAKPVILRECTRAKNLFGATDLVAVLMGSFAGASG